MFEWIVVGSGNQVVQLISYWMTKLNTVLSILLFTLRIKASTVQLQDQCGVNNDVDLWSDSVFEVIGTGLKFQYEYQYSNPGPFS